MLRTGERSQNQKQQRQMTLTTMQTGQNCCAQLNNSSTTLVANASETSERVRKKSKTLIFGEGKKGEDLSQTRLKVMFVSATMRKGQMTKCKMSARNGKFRFILLLKSQLLKPS
jgi:hypothetical protein